MDLTAVDELELDLPDRPGKVWKPGDAWLAGGTWLFSEPQPRVRRLLDLTTLRWPSLTVRADGLEVAATCTVAELFRFSRAMPADWTVGPLIRSCCRCFVASFKIWNEATVGGNLCNALPAGPMTSLLAGLAGVCTIWSPDGAARQVPVADFVVGDNRHVLAPGEVLRSVHVPAASLRGTAAIRQESLTRYGRSAALVVGLRTDSGIRLSVTASVKRPLLLDLSAGLGAALAAIPAELYHDDVHGHPLWRRHLTALLADDVLAEIS